MPRAGNVIAGKYVLEQEIGAGSMGAVWRATHSTLGRPFAVKFLRWYGEGAARLEARFVQEAHMLAAIQHRFVVDIVDSGLTDEGTPYMVMEYLAGESLGDRLARMPPLSLRETVDLIVSVLQGLEAVHEAGIVHRDLKPENVVLVSEAGEIIPKLVDFGISRIEERVETPGPRTHLTEPGVAIGTPSYMSPEQVRSLPVDRRSDLYSVGVILYQALTGVLPYDADEVRDIMKAAAVGGARPVHVVRPQISEGLSEIVARAMSVSPDDRFDSATELAAALLASMDEEDELLPCGPFVTDPAGLMAALDGQPANVVSPTPRLLRAPSTVKTRRSGRRARITALVGGAAAAAAVLTALLWPPRGAAPPVPVVGRAQAAPAPAPLAAVAPAPSQPAPAPQLEPQLTADRQARARRRVLPRRPLPPPETFRSPGF